MQANLKMLNIKIVYSPMHTVILRWQANKLDSDWFHLSQHALIWTDTTKQRPCISHSFTLFFVQEKEALADKSTVAPISTNAHVLKPAKPLDLIEQVMLGPSFAS